MQDELNRLIIRVKNGDEAAFTELSEVYAPLVNSMSEKYAGKSGRDDALQAVEDFAQDARLALYRAAMTYTQGDVTFGLYAKVCMRNALVSALRRMSRKRNTSARDDIYQASATLTETVSPVLIGEDKEKLMLSLSPYERRVFELYISGEKICRIANALGKTSKSVSNAVCRIKEKAHLLHENG